MDRIFEATRLRHAISTNAMDPRYNVIRGFRCWQVFVNNQMFAVECTAEKKADYYAGLKKFILDYGEPEMMITDGSKEKTLPGT